MRRTEFKVNAADLAAQLAQGLAQLGLALPEAAQASLLQFVALLAKWNQAYNLTAVRDPAAMLPRHLLDSLAVLPHLRGPSVLDVGSGAGLPGIPLALARPDLHFTLLDSNGKKTRFITQAVTELGLANVSVVQRRVEEFQAPACFDTVITRAFAAVAEVVNVTGRLCAPQGQLLLMKGAYPMTELEALPPEFRLDQSIRLNIPGLGAERHLLVIRARQ